MKSCLDEVLFQDIISFLDMDISLLWACLSQFCEVNIMGHDQITIAIKHFKVHFDSLVYTLFNICLVNSGS
jgi:hypothetical protein